MKYIYEQGDHQHALLLFHGTGGHEQDMLPIAEIIDPKAPVLSIRGNVLEQGMPRYFRRLSPGVYDVDNLFEEGEKITAELNELTAKYDIDINKSTFVGYSNGANMIVHLLLTGQIKPNKAVILHPLYPVDREDYGDLSGCNILITTGAQDMIAPANEAMKVKSRLEAIGANVKVHITDGAHGLLEEELEEVRQFNQR